MRVKSAIILIFAFLLLSACNLGKAPEPTAAPTDAPLPVPSVPPTASSPLAVLLMPADMDKAISDAYQTAVYDLTQESGMRFQVRNSLSAQEIDPGLKIVVALPPDPGIAALAVAAPQVQFLAINIPGVSAGNNISALATGSQVDIPAFVAGYTAAMVTDDFHIGMLFPRGNGSAQAAAAAFANGMAYYCGLCQPFYYLPYSFPQFQDIPAEEPKSHYPAYADVLIVQHKVNTVYLYPDVTAKELTDYLSSTGTYMIGTAVPNPKPGTWIMTIQPDEVKAIRTAWADLVAGKGGQNVLSPLGLADLDPTVVTPGKQRLVQQVLDDLQAGRLTTGVNP